MFIPLAYSGDRAEERDAGKQIVWGHLCGTSATPCCLRVSPSVRRHDGDVLARGGSIC